jgi:hypothetical protein
VIDGSQIKVEGNQVVVITSPPSGVLAGISTVNNDGEVVLIEGNQVIGWGTGIVATSSGKMVAKNSVSSIGVGSNSGPGIDAAGTSVVVGNVVTGGFPTGIHLSGSVRAVGNAVNANLGPGFTTDATFTGTLEKNNIVGNGNTFIADHNCGLDTQTVGLLAKNNYWGAATGPGAPPANDVCSVMGGTATVTPFATKPFSIKAPIKP